MRRHTWISPVVGMLALGVFFLTVARARDDAEEKAKIAAAQKAAPDVEGLADAAADADALKKKADAIIKKYDDLGPIMWQMKPRDKGGLGVGAKPGAYDPDAIELQLLQLGNPKKGITAKDLKNNNADYQRMVQVIRGIAEPTPSYADKYIKAGAPGATKDNWIRMSKDMQKGSDDLLGAIKSNDLKAVKKAMDNLNKNCNDCHTAFRDN